MERLALLMVIGIAVLFLILTVLTMIWAFTSYIPQSREGRNVAELHKTRQELIIEIQKIKEEQKRTMSALAQLNAMRKNNSRKHEEIRNDVLLVKDVKFEKDAETKDKQTFAETQKIKEEQKRTMSALAQLNAVRKNYLRKHEEIRNDVLLVKDVKFEKNAETKDEQTFAETQNGKLTPEVQKEITQPEGKLDFQSCTDLTDKQLMEELVNIKKDFSHLKQKNTQDIWTSSDDMPVSEIVVENDVRVVSELLEVNREFSESTIDTESPISISTADSTEGLF